MTLIETWRAVESAQFERWPSVLDCKRLAVIVRPGGRHLQSAQVLAAFTSTFTAMPAGVLSIASQSPRSTSGLDLGWGR